ncbi:SDR family oxidoreductase [Leptospira sp. 96542]|nr:SDR family oxidoreductase [Leptospira sp. 96542]
MSQLINKNMKFGNILILGASGMLGSALFKVLSDMEFEVYGTVRTLNLKRFFLDSELSRIVQNVDVLNTDDLASLFIKVKPKVVINCVGVIKQLSSSKDPLSVIPINSLFPHRLAQLCMLVGSRMVHISTDCVFDGTKGNYSESDRPDANDLYGKTKELGEISDLEHVITLRTSIIGHEISSSRSLVDWFLNSEGVVPGYRRAIFSGLPTYEIANVIGQFIIPNHSLSGLYHISVDPISKHDLLCLIRDVYDKKINITPMNDFEIDRSLNSEKFQRAVGYRPPSWSELIRGLKEYKEKYLGETDVRQ